MVRSYSRAARALLAAALMVGFYVLALAIATVLLWIPWAEITIGHHVYLKFTLICILGAGIILWSIVPRWERFEAPGPLLDRDRHPRLFRLIDHVAEATGQKNASEVYLVPDVNAWVAERGGFVGFGSRRVMGLGLPLMQTLSVREIEAVLAHEFGHFDAGDTKLGPWVYKTRAAIGRTLEGLQHHSGLLQKPFEWYGAMFLRVSHGVSRAQEFSADRIAARVAGSRALATALRKLCAATAAFPQYWTSEVEPVLASGFRPPLARGFQLFTSVDPIAKAMDAAVEEALSGSNADPFDTHPPLSDRLLAVASFPSGPDAEDAPAVGLLGDIEELERELLGHFGGAEMAALKSVAWDEVGTRVVVPNWTKNVNRNAAAFAGLTASTLPERVADLERFTKSLVGFPDGAPAEGRRAYALWLLCAALGAALARSGWTVRCLPGQPLSVVCPAGSVDPDKVGGALAEGKMTSEAWRAECERLGIASLSLAPVVA